MTFRRVSVLPALAFSVGLCLVSATASASPESIRTAKSETAETAETADSQATSAPSATIKLIRNAILRSRALDRLAGYRAVGKDDMRFLVVIDRRNQRDETGAVTHVAKDLLSTADGKLWILDRHRVRPATERDLAAHQFSLEEAQLGLSASKRRPVSLVVPRRLVSRR